MVQISARLCQAAEADAILVTKAVREELEGDFNIRELGELCLKGLPRPVSVFEVAWR
jgi:class 3 adenylate cyclase